MKFISFYAPLMIALLAPLPLGSQEYVWVALWCCALSGVLVLIYKPHPFVPVVFGLLGLFLFLVMLQQVPVGFSLAHPVWQKVSSLVGEPVVPTLSVSPAQGWIGLGGPLLYALALLCGLSMTRDQDQAWLALKIMSYAGAVYAVIGIGQFLLSPDGALWEQKVQHVKNLTATFRNRNTAASFFGMMTLVSFAIILMRVRRHISEETVPRDLVLLALFHKSPKLWLTNAVLFLTLVALFMTSSRAGILLCFSMMGLMAFLMLKSIIPRTKSMLVAGLGLMAILLIFSEILGVRLADRIGREGLSDSFRWEAYKASLSLIWQNPWLGTGYGTFAEVFPSVRTEPLGIVGTWNRAHSTPLEIAVEMGLPFALGLIAVWVGCLVYLLRRALWSPKPFYSVLGLTCGLFLGLHSLVDYPLQIPGLAVFFYILFGLCLSQVSVTQRTV